MALLSNRGLADVRYRLADVSKVNWEIRLRQGNGTHVDRKSRWKKVYSL